MLLTLTLSEDEAAALRRRATLENRSIQEVTCQAVRTYLEQVGRVEVLNRVLDDELPRYAETLERLAW